MRVGILQCDAVQPELQPCFGDYPDMFRRLLDGSGGGLAFATFDLVAGRFPGDPHDCDAWLITGSRAGVGDGAAWIEAASELVRRIHAARLPLVGICFGHQLIAQALGGRVERCPRGWGVGVHEVQVHRRAPWMRPERDRLALLVSHQDQVVVPPDGGEILAGSAFCPIAMLSVGDRTLGFQGHPEFEQGYLRRLLDGRRGILGDERYQRACDSLDREVDAATAAEWMRRFIAVPGGDR